MSLQSWFRTHTKHLMAGLVVLLMVSFSIPAASVVRFDDPVVGELHGEDVHQSDLDRARDVTFMLSALAPGQGARDFTGEMDLLLVQLAPRIYQGLSQLEAQMQQEGMPEQMRQQYQAQVSTMSRALQYVRSLRPMAFGRIYNFVFDGDIDREQSAWRAHVLLAEARRLDIQVTTTDTEQFKEFVQVMGLLQMLNPRYLQQMREMSANRIGQATEALLQILRMTELRADAVAVSNSQLWAEFHRGQVSRRIEFVELPADMFEQKVEPAEDELRGFYEEHKENPMSGMAPGYKVGRRVRTKVAMAPMDEIARSLDITEEDLRGYYDDPANADEFALPEEEADGEATSDDEASDDEDPDAVAEETEGEEGEDDAPAAEENGAEADEVMEEETAEDETEPEEEEPEVRKRPFEEVKEDIRETLRESRTRRMARERVQSARNVYRDVLDSYPSGPLEIVADRAGLTPPVVLEEDGKPWLTRTQLRGTLPTGAGDAVAYVFDENAPVNGYTFEVDADTPFVLKLMGKRGEEVLPFEEVREQVREDYVPERALELAEERAAALAEDAEAEGIESALSGLNTELETPEETPIQVQTSELFNRDAWRVQAGVGGGRALVEASFNLPVDKWGHAVAGRSAFALKPLEPQDVASAEAQLEEEFADMAGQLRARHFDPMQSMGNPMAAGQNPRRQAVTQWMQALLDASDLDVEALMEQARKAADNAPAQ